MMDLANTIETLPIAPLDATIPNPISLGEPYERTATHEKGCSAFVAKTYAMVSDESLRDLIRWEPAGTSFVVLQPDKLAPTLAQHFKHRKFSSFVRQLNMYNYKKVGNPKQWEFYHDAFRRGRTHLLRYIKRKKSTPSNKSKVAAGLKTEVLGLKSQRDTLQHDIDLLTEQQCDMEVQLTQILEENGDLRTELASSKQAHEAMRSCVDQIMSFVTATFPDHDLSELTALLNACPAPPSLAVRPRDDGMGSDLNGLLEDEPSRKRRKLGHDCGEEDQLCVVPMGMGLGVMSKVKEEPLLPHADKSSMMWQDAPPHQYPFLTSGGYGDDLNIFDLPDVDQDDHVPTASSVPDSPPTRVDKAPTVQSMNDFLDTILHS
jgi:hypothetical protein